MYFRFGNIYVNSSESFQYWDSDKMINLKDMNDLEVTEFENKYIIQLMHDINHFCGYSLKKIFMVTLGSAFELYRNNGEDINSYNEYWNMLEVGTLDKKAIKLLSLGIEDKYLQKRIVSDEEVFYKIIQSENILETIIELFGYDSIEYYIMIL